MIDAVISPDQAEKLTLSIAFFHVGNTVVKQLWCKNSLFPISVVIASKLVFTLEYSFSVL